MTRSLWNSAAGKPRKEPKPSDGRYYDAYEGSQLIGVAASTIRSWVGRGYLQTGRYQGGKLAWTERQLARAKAAARHATVALNNGQSACACGAQLKVYSKQTELIVECVKCEALFAIDRAVLYETEPYRSPGTVGLDPNETTVDPMEKRIGPSMRTRAMGIYLRDIAKGPQVYFIRLGPYAKIGTSLDVRRRISALSLQLGHLLATIDGDVKMEKLMHHRFGTLNAFGEWFYLKDELLDFVIHRQREQVALVLEGTREAT